MRPNRKDDLIGILLTSSQPLSGSELALRLRVSTRSVRAYVSQINRGSQVIVATRAGYSLHASARKDLARRLATKQFGTPDQRIVQICRRLAQAGEPTSVYDLALELWVSDSTIEADLARVRGLLKQFELRLVRHQDKVQIEGPELNRRRLVRHFIYESTDGLVPATWNALATEFATIDVMALRDGVQEILKESHLRLNEFALSDVVVHLAVTIDRVAHGYQLPQSPESDGKRNDAIVRTVERISSTVHRTSNVELPATERDVLYNVIAVRGVVEPKDGVIASVVDPRIRTLVAQILEDFSHKYHLTAASPAAINNLALHVQGVVARARMRTPLPRPLGASFRSSHPLLHDLAVDFAAEIERMTGLTVSPDEFDYLALHMGMQYMSAFEDRDIVPITLIAPHYYDLASRIRQELEVALGTYGVIEDVSHSLDFDFTAPSTDLVISTVQPAVACPVPVVVVKPVPTREDIARVADVVRLEHERAIRRRIKFTLSTLLDPSLFEYRQESVSQLEALELLTHRLSDAGYTDESFLDGVLDRERRFSTAFGGDFAIPHSMRMDAHGTAIAALCCAEGIEWGASRVHLVLLFCLSPDGSIKFRDVFDEVTRLLSDGGNVARLVAVGTSARQFITTFVELLDNPK